MCLFIKPFIKRTQEKTDKKKKKSTSQSQRLCRKNGLKGHCHEHRFESSRVQKHILQQRKPSKTGPVLIKISMPVYWSLINSIIVIPPGAQDPNFKSQPDFFQVLEPWQYPRTIYLIILQAKKFLQCDWLKRAVFNPNLKYLHVKITVSMATELTLKQWRKDFPKATTKN